MFFNLWNNINYINKIIIIIIAILATFLISSKIIIAVVKKIKKQYTQRKVINKLIKNYNKLDKQKKINFIKNTLGLNSSYKIARFLGEEQKYIVKQINSNNISILNDLIINKLKGKKKNTL